MRSRFLIPGFLRDINRHLLVNNPRLWITQLHYVTFWWMVITALIALLAMIFPVTIERIPEFEMWFTVFIILSIVGIAIWTYRHVLFNIEKNQGKRSVLDEFVYFFTGFICVAMFMSFSYTFTSVLNWKTASLVPEEELVHDINTLNLGNKYFVSWHYDYREYYDSTSGTMTYDYEDYHNYHDFTPGYYNMPGLLGDSVIRIAYKNQDTREERLNAIRNYIQVFAKYNQRVSRTPEQVLEHFERAVERRSETNGEENFWTKKNEMRSMIYKIARAKSWEHDMFEKEVIWILLYCILYYVSLLLLFRNVRWQQFLITLAVFALAPIILGLLDVFLHGRGEVFLTCVVLIYIFCLVQSVLALPAKRFSPYKSIYIMIFYILTPVMGMIFIGWLDEMGIWPSRYYENYPYGYDDYYYDTRYYLLQRAIEIAAWVGPVVFVLVIMPFVKEVLVRLHALPKRS